MAFDPSVIGSIGDSVPDPVAAVGRAYQLKDMVDSSKIRSMQLQDLTTEQSDKAARRKALEGVDVSNLDQVSKAAGKLGGEAGMKLMSEANQLATQKAQREQAVAAAKEHLVKMGETEWKMVEEQSEKVSNIAVPVYDHFKRLIDSGVPPSKAAELMQPEYTAAYHQLRTDPAFQSPQVQKMILDLGEKFDPLKIEPVISGHKQAADLLREAAKERESSRNIESEIRVRESKEAREQRQETAAQDEDALVKAIGEYRQPPPSAGNRSKAAQRLLSKVQQQYPNYDYTNWEGKSKAVKSFDTGKQGDAVRSLNVAVQHLDVLQDAFKALDNGDIKAFNKAKSLYLEQTGNELPTNVEAAADFVGNEVSKAAMGAGVSGALADRENIKKQLTVAASQKQSGGQIQTFKKLLAGQLKGLKKQYENATGLKNFEDKLDPQTRAALESAGDDVKKNDPLGIR